MERALRALAAGRGRAAFYFWRGVALAWFSVVAMVVLTAAKAFLARPGPLSGAGMIAVGFGSIAFLLGLMAWRWPKGE